MKIVTVVGARPQFVKLKQVSKWIEKNPNIEEIIVHTGQHYDADMSEVFFKLLDLPKPKISLGINRMQSYEMIGKMILEIGEYISLENPDMVLVYGDTNSTVAAAIAASYMKIPVAHVEAGMRSDNLCMPEEKNRRITDHISSLLLCPTDRAVVNLAREGIDNDRIRVCGDVMYDGFLEYSVIAKKLPTLDKLNIKEKEYSLLTIHRESNTNAASLYKLSGILESICEYPIIFPMHPRTKNTVKNWNIPFPDHVKIIDPVDYLTMINLEMNARMILTDSGGVQKEAYFAQVPCLVLRDETEWNILLEYGYTKLVGLDKDKIIEFYNSTFTWKKHHLAAHFGNGFAGKRIVKYLLDFYEHNIKGNPYVLS